MLFHNQTDLSKLTRAELELRAADLGIAEPGGFPNKDALVAEIERYEVVEVVEGDGAEDADAEADADAAAESEFFGPSDFEGEPEPESEDVLRVARYRVLKAITLSDGRTAMPGEEIDASGPEWPARRPKQLVDSGHLRAI